jgi:hypothetical protein
MEKSPSRNESIATRRLLEKLASFPFVRDRVAVIVDDRPEPAEVVGLL